MLLNTVLNIICIKYYGLTGAAIATAISLAITQIVTFLVSSKYYPIPYFYFKMAAGSAVATVSVFLINFYQNTGGFSVREFIIKVIFYVVVSFVLFIILNYMKIATIKRSIFKF